MSSSQDFDDNQAPTWDWDNLDSQPAASSNDRENAPPPKKRKKVEKMTPDEREAEESRRRLVHHNNAADNEKRTAENRKKAEHRRRMFDTWAKSKAEFSKKLVELEDQKNEVYAQLWNLEVNKADYVAKYGARADQGELDEVTVREFDAYFDLKVNKPPPPWDEEDDEDDDEEMDDGA